MDIIQLANLLTDQEDVIDIRRKAWLKQKHPNTCVYSGGNFYTDRNWDTNYQFSADDLLGKDWEYKGYEWKSQ